MKNNPLVAEAAGKLVFGRDRVLVSTRDSRSFGKMGRRPRAALFEYWAGGFCNRGDYVNIASVCVDRTRRVLGI